MARLITGGFEQQVIDTGAANRAEGQGYINVGAPTIETTVVRSGAASLKVTASGSYTSWDNIGQTLDRNYYWRFYLRFPTAPSANAVVARVVGSAGAICSVRLSTGRLVALLNAASANIGSSSAALAVDTWHRIEVRVKVPASGNGELELHVNDVAVANNTSTAIGNVAPDDWLCGQLSGTVASLYYDDVALNDDQGASQNGRPGPGKIVLLKPISDSSRTGWTDGNAGTSNLYQAVDNTPPIGEATSGTTATSQVEDGTNNATDTYVPNLQTYSTGGLVSTDVVLLTQALATIGNSTTTTRDAGLTQSSNPSGSETVSGTTPGSAAGTFPTGWNTIRNAVAYSPAVTLGTSPQLTLRKASASTDVLACAALGLYVEFRSPIIVAVGQATEADTANAVTPKKTRAASQSSETDTAQATTARKTRALGQSTETDAAQAITTRKTVAVGQALETDTAQAIVFASGAAVGQATETDVAQAVTAHKTVAVGQASETDTAQTVTFASGAAVGQASETDAAQAVSVHKTVHVGQAGETDLAQVVTQAGVVGQALETDVAQPITVVQAGLATTSGGGWAMPVKLPRKHQFFPVLGVTERDTALPVGVVQGLPPRVRYVRRVKESNLALPVDVVQTPSQIQIEDDELLLIL